MRRRAQRGRGPAGDVGVVDLEERKLLRTLPGFREPQGIASQDALSGCSISHNYRCPSKLALTFQTIVYIL
jgi:hypothetical protein